MTGSFSSLNTALSGLRYQQVALDMASTNVANATTEGYVRRRVTGETVAAGHARRSGRARRRSATASGPPASSGWSTPSSTPARAPSTASRATSTCRPRCSAGSRPGSGSPATPGSRPPSRRSAPRCTTWPTRRAATRPAARCSRRPRTSPTRSTCSRATWPARPATSAPSSCPRWPRSNSVAQDLASTNKAVVAGRVAQNDVSTLEDTRDRLALRLAELTGGTATIRRRTAAWTSPWATACRW